ncbi:hypothetical protein DN539_34250, partial [Burkholderia multivorans]
ILSPGVTVEDAAAPSLALYALLIGVGINMLLIVFYTIFAHRTFSGPLYQDAIPGSTEAGSTRPAGSVRAAGRTGEREGPRS